VPDDEVPSCEAVSHELLISQACMASQLANKLASQPASQPATQPASNPANRQMGHPRPSQSQLVRQLRLVTSAMVTLWAITTIRHHLCARPRTCPVTTSELRDNNSGSSTTAAVAAISSQSQPYCSWSHALCLNPVVGKLKNRTGVHSV
jgi:hypothetical protein